MAAEDLEIEPHLDFFAQILSGLKKPQLSEIEARSVLVRLEPIELEPFLAHEEQQIALHLANSTGDAVPNNATNDSNGMKEEPATSINGASSDLATGTTSTTTATTASRIFTPNIISKFQNLIYTLELSCNSSINVVYTGDANEITLKDLEPATAYRLRVFAALPAAPATIANAAAAASTTTASASSSSTSSAAANSTPPPAAPGLLTLCRGEYTQAVSFETRACEPAQPEPPKAWPGAKKKNELGVRWQPPVDNGSKIVSYTLEYQPVTHPISEENGVEEQLSPDEYTVAYRGAQKQFIVKKLTPSTLYAFRLQAENSLGASAWSSPTLIYTSGCVPEAPPRPQLLAATTSTLTLGGWTISSSACPLDYELQMHAVEDVTASAHGYLTVCNGPMEAYDVRDLKRAMAYLFRVRAKNDEGYSLWSEVVRFRTNADVPRPPIKLKVERTKFQHYRVQWEAPRDDGGSPVLFYTLEICSTEANSSSSNNIEAATTTTSQASSPSGFYQCIYKGGNCEYTISATVAASSLSSPPTSPLITPPTPTSPTTTSTVIQPGHTYLVRCSAHNAIGASSPSDPPTQFTSAAIAPGPCSPPKLVAKAKAHSAVLKWYAPESNGGSEVVEYELRLIDCHTSDDEDDDVTTTSATQRRRSSNGAVTSSQDRDGEIVYRGNESQTMVSGLAPGRLYRVQVRAANKVGWGEWSPEFEFTSGAGCPDAPNMPLINSRASNSIQISWNEPNSNGSAITEYRLEWSLKETGGGSTSVEPLFTPLYTGPLTRHELKSSHFLPSTRYLFRVQALNVNGSSAFSSPPTEFLTPPAVPSMVASMRVEQTTSESIRVSWKPPQSNGSPILFYNLDFGEVAAGTSATIVVNNSQTSEGGTIEYTLDMLQPDTSYKMRIQAANSVGIGPFSNLVKVKTKALAPQPPHIELISTTYNSIKLKWTSIIASQSSSSSATSATLGGTESGVVSVQQPTQYNLEMALIERAREEEEMSPQFRCVYRGPANTYKASKLLDSATYAFRIAAANDDAGQGRWSAEYRFTTARSPPLVTRPPSVLEIGPTSCLVEWMSAKHVDQTQHDALEYCLQVQSRKDSDYREIYRGSDCSYRLRELDPNTEYSVRVCAYLTTEHMCAPYSPHTSFQTPKVISPRTPHHNSSGSNNTLQQKKSTGGDSSNSEHRKKSSPSIWSTLLSALMFKPTSNSSPQSAKESSPSSHQQSHHHHHQAKTARELGKLNGALNKYGGMSTKKPPRAVESSSTDVDYYERTPLWTTSDQYWAMCFILALVLVAFVIACVVNSVYTNYYAVVIPDSPTKSPTADL